MIQTASAVGNPLASFRAFHEGAVPKAPFLRVGRALGFGDARESSRASNKLSTADGQQSTGAEVVPFISTTREFLLTLTDGTGVILDAIDAGQQHELVTMNAHVVTVKDILVNTTATMLTLAVRISNRKHIYIVVRIQNSFAGGNRWTELHECTLALVNVLLVPSPALQALHVLRLPFRLRASKKWTVKATVERIAQRITGNSRRDSAVRISEKPTPVARDGT
ncbi:hypothetical protein FI667_g14393, partial [Globisporangium splendens]